MKKALGTLALGLSAVSANATALADSARVNVASAGGDAMLAGGAIIGATALVFAIGLIIFVVKRK